MASSSLQRRGGQQQNAFGSLGTRKAAASTPRQNAPFQPKSTSSVIDLLSDEEGENGAGEDLLLSKPKLDAESNIKADDESMEYLEALFLDDVNRIVRADQERKRNVPDLQDSRSDLPLEAINISDTQEMRHSREDLRKGQHSNDMTRSIDASSNGKHSPINALAPRSLMSDEDGLSTTSRKAEKLQKPSTPPTLDIRESTQLVTKPNKRASETFSNGAAFRERGSEPDRSSKSTARPVFIQQPKSRSEDHPRQKAAGSNKRKAHQNVLDHRGGEPKQVSLSNEEASNFEKSETSSATARAVNLSAQSKVTSSRKDAARQEFHITGSPQKPVAPGKKSDTLDLGPEAEINSKPPALVASIGDTVKKANGGDASGAKDGAMERSKTKDLSKGSESLVLPPLAGKSDQAFASLSAAKQVEIIVGRYMDEVRIENEYWNKAWLRRARCSKANAQQSADVSAAKPYSFAKLKLLPLIQADKKSRSQGAVKLLVEKSVPGGKPIKVPFIVQPNIIEPHDDMPSYSHFVNIKSNFLAPNVTTLQHWPYFGDDFDYSEDAKGLKEQYSFDMDQRSTKLLRLAQAQKFACPYHGEIEELEDSDEEADSDTRKAITTDIINPPAVNNRKRTLLGQSGIHGFGLYAGQTIRQHDFVGEYKGEIITKEEAERRGAVYEKQQLSYLFTLNAFQEIDSTYFGNNIRFINHAGNGKNNLYPRIFMVNTVHRIALFADKTIQKGEELLFDYGPKFPDEQLGGKKAYQPRVRNSNMVHDFWEVEVERDATGYRRARKAAKPTGKGRARKTDASTGEKPPKQQRGPPPGAGGRPRKNASTKDADAQSLEPDERLSAGDRLAAFNVAVEPAGEGMGLDAVNGADDEDEFEPESSADSTSDDGDEQEDEDPGPARRSRRGRRLKVRRPRD
ncbi:hypothetical protein KC345_g4293 [Hortaea werneckii]|nr:hypothetical protein KC345_g4293 [Hortaea werneckii]